MNYESGIFKCPKCGNKKANNFKNWTKRDEYVDGELKAKWIFYEEKITRIWICCYCFLKEEEDKKKSLLYNIITCKYNELFYLYPLVMILYFLIFFWIDLFNYLCLAIKTYVVISGERETQRLIQKKRIFLKKLKD